MTNKKKKGFTLIELIVVIAILGILAAVMIPKFTGFQDKAKATQALVDAKSIATAMDGWIVEHNGAFPVVGVGAIGTDSDEILDVALGGHGDIANITTLANGGFTWTAVGTTFKAGRTTAADKVEMK